MEVAPYDEVEIEGNDLIIRRVNSEQHIVPDENTGCFRISSKLFSPSSDPNGGMSVDILKLIESMGVDACKFVTTPEYIGSVSFHAACARACGLRVGYDPLPNNLCHGEVWGKVGRPNRFTSRQKRALVEACEWFVTIPDVKIR